MVKVGDVIPRESTDADSKLKRASNDAFAQCISSNNGCLREKTDGTNAVLLSTITAGLFRSVRGAKGGFPPWGAPQATFPPGGGSPS